MERLKSNDFQKFFKKAIPSIPVRPVCVFLLLYNPEELSEKISGWRRKLKNIFQLFCVPLRSQSKEKKSAECAASTERDAAGRPPMRFILCGPNESLPSHWSASLDTVPSRKADGSSLACWLPTCGRSFFSLLCDPSDVCKRAARATKRSRAPLTRKRVAGRRASSAHNCLRLVVCVLFCFPVSYRFVLFPIIVSLQSE